MSMMRGIFVSLTLTAQINHLNLQSLIQSQIPLASLSLLRWIRCLRLACCVRCKLWMLVFTKKCFVYRYDEAWASRRNVNCKRNRWRQVSLGSRTRETWPNSNSCFVIRLPLLVQSQHLGRLGEATAMSTFWSPHLQQLQSEQGHLYLLFYFW